MNMSYTLPQVEVFQVVSQIPTAVTTNLNPYVYGANYLLRRYAQAAEKPLTAFGAYSPSAGNSGAYPNVVANSKVDRAYVKVYADNAWLQYQAVPESSANPLVLTSNGIANKLRAAPRIVGGGQDSLVTMATAGYHNGLLTMPVAYHFYPTSSFSLGAAAGAFTYKNTDGITGSMAIPANATVSGVKVQGPDGLVMDFSSAHAVKSPRVIKFAKTFPAATKYFTIAPLASQLQDMVDRDLDSTGHAGMVTIAVDDSAVSDSITYDGTSLVISFQASDSLAVLRAAIMASTDIEAILADFAISDIVGAGTDTGISAEDQDSNAISTATAIVPDCYRVYVYANSWVFKTANGVSRSASLLKDVMVGDKIQWTVTPASTGIQISGYSTITGLEADYTMPNIGTPAAAAGNSATQAGTDLSSGAANLVAGSDNQNTDLDMTTSKTFAMSASLHYPLLSLMSDILTDDYVITVTKAGLSGVAQVSIANASGTYSRTAVPVEAAAGAGQVYVGNNMYVNFITGGDANFYIGDSWTVKAVKAPFTAVANEVASGIYVGSADTTYQVQVTRGGVFSPVATVIPGITSTSSVLLHSDITGWTGGDVDDEYILTCTSAGNLNAAVFALASQRGDNASGLSFIGYGSGNKIIAGASGLGLYFTTSGTPSFAVGDYFVVVVKAARPKVRITDSAGVDQQTSVVVTAGGIISVGLNGVLLSFPPNFNTLGGLASTGGLVLGDIFTIAARASDPGAIKTLVLADDLPASIAAGLMSDGEANYAPDLFSAALMLVGASKAIPAQDGAVPGAYNWTAGTSTMTVNPNVMLQDASWVDGLGNQPYLPLVTGSLYVEYRSLLQDYADAIYSITDIGQVVPELGPVDPDNPLAMAVNTTLENIGRGTCYFSAIATDDVAGDTAALSRGGLVNYLYTLNPAGVTDPARHAVLEAHIDSMSTEIKKRWRIGLIGRELPTIAPVLTAATNPAGTDWKATVGVDSRTGLVTKVTMTQAANLLTVLKVGDQVQLQFATDAWGNITYSTNSVAELGSNTVFYLASPLASAELVASKIVVNHPLDVQEQADAVKAIATGYDNKRMYVCFPGNLGLSSGTYVNAAYGAAAVTGLVGSVAPQQGLTNIELNGIGDVPYSYGLFSYDQLNEIAGGGTLIIMQDTQGGTVYVRHQISTAYIDGNLNTQEMSMVKNLDSISYYFATLLAPFIGKYNVTPELISVIQTQIQDGLNFLGSLTGVGLLGPQVILSNGNTKIQSVAQHPTLKDHMLAVVNIELPAPLNVIQLSIVV